MNPTLRASRAERSLALFAWVWIAIALGASVAAIVTSRPASIEIWGPIIVAFINIVGATVLRGIREMRGMS